MTDSPQSSNDVPISENSLSASSDNAHKHNNKKPSGSAGPSVSNIFYLAFTEIIKTCRGSVLGAAWLFVKPAVYIVVFWFALDLGLRAGSSVSTSETPYVVWLASGIIPWFFMQDLLNTGSDVYNRYKYLVNKIKFPLPHISTFFSLSKFFIYLASMVLFLAICAVCGISFGPTMIQVPLIALVMYAFFTVWSIAVSPLSAISKDFANLIKTISMPLFWVSGVIFDVSSLNIPWIQTLLAFNPVTTFVEAHRMAICQGTWVWEDPFFLGSFLAVFAVTALMAVVVQKKFATEVADVL